MRSIIGTLVGFFVGAVGSALLCLILFVGYFFFAALVLGNVQWAVELHNWLRHVGIIPWIVVLLSPCFICTLVGLFFGHGVFTKFQL
ncbi:MAG: hypothetical protein KDB27_00340 [Planctomycetales bacterium]|nr:hypothetical protein [Planctomycetales bacterium]